MKYRNMTKFGLNHLLLKIGIFSSTNQLPDAFFEQYFSNYTFWHHEHHLK